MQGTNQQLKDAQVGLLTAYRDAMRASDQLDLFEGALVKNVVANSISSASRRVRTRYDAEDVASALETYSTQVAKEDYVGKFGGKATSIIIDKLTGLILGGLSIGAIIALPVLLINDVIDAGQTFGASGNAAVARFLFYPGVLAAAVALVKNYVKNIGELWAGPGPAREVLSRALDVPESRFFALVGSSPPIRLYVTLVGPALAIPMIILGGLVVLFVGSAILGAFTPSQEVPAFQR